MVGRQGRRLSLVSPDLAARGRPAGPSLSAGGRRWLTITPKDAPEAERIISVACRMGDLILSAPAPARHGHVLRAARCEPGDQGFLTSEGRFVDRKEAYRIARASGQPWVRMEGPEYYQGDELYSEDVW